MHLSTNKTLTFRAASITTGRMKGSDSPTARPTGDVRICWKLDMGDGCRAWVACLLLFMMMGERWLDGGWV